MIMLKGGGGEGVNTVKTLNLKKVGVMTPPTSYGGAAFAPQLLWWRRPCL